MLQNRNVCDLPEPETSGIFVIKEAGSIIYVGQSGDCMRDRILSHLSGYDAQTVGKYLKQYSKEYKQQHVTIGWVAVKGAKFKEHHYLSCIAERQDKWPKCNLKRGRPPKSSKRLST